MSACNKRFGEIGVKVIARISVCPLTVSDNPNCVQSIPNFAKPLGLCAMQVAAYTNRKMRHINSLDNTEKPC